MQLRITIVSGYRTTDGTYDTVTHPVPPVGATVWVDGRSGTVKEVSYNYDDGVVYVEANNE